MIHRALMGSIERFVGILNEHYAGAFPMWISPTQVTIVPVADRHIGYARKVKSTMVDSELRVAIDEADDTVGEKIRRAITQKSPAIVVVGDQDEENDTVGLRLRGDEHERRGLDVDSAVEELASLAAPPR